MLSKYNEKCPYKKGAETDLRQKRSRPWDESRWRQNDREKNATLLALKIGAWTTGQGMQLWMLEKTKKRDYPLEPPEGVCLSTC